MSYNYTPQPSGQPNYPVHLLPPENNAAAQLGMITGIVGYALAWIPLLGIPLGLIVGIIAIILSGVGMTRSSGRGMATTGMIFGVLTVVWKLIPGLNWI